MRGLSRNAAACIACAGNGATARKSHGRSTAATNDNAVSIRARGCIAQRASVRGVCSEGIAMNCIPIPERDPDHGIGEDEPWDDA